MKKIAFYTAGILGFSALVGTALTVLYPTALIAPLAAWTLTTGFVTFMTGLAAMSFSNANNRIDQDFGAAGAVTMLAGIAACAAIRLTTEPAASAPVEPAARHAFADSTTRPCADPRAGIYVPPTDRCLAETQPTAKG